MTNKELIRLLSKDKEKLEKIISNYKLYNFRNKAINIAAKGVLAAFCLAPYMVSSYSVHTAYEADGLELFHKDDIIQYASIETIDTTDGTHVEYLSYDNNYKTNTLEYTSGWHQNDKDLYEKETTLYKINKKEILNKDELLSMSQEELNSIYKVDTISKIQKSQLDAEDYIYNNEGVVITNSSLSKDIFTERKETTGEDAWSTVKFFLSSFVIGYAFFCGERILYKKLLKKRYELFKDYFKIIEKDEIKALKEIYDIKMQNIDLITKPIEEENGHTYSLRKKKV